MIPLASLSAQFVETSPASFQQIRRGPAEIRFAGAAVLRGAVGGEGKASRLAEPATPLYLGYPHGPKDAQFVPAGRQKVTLSVELTGPVDARINASPDSFLCNDRADSPLSSTFGSPESSLNNGVYDRKADWLLTAEGSGVRLTPEGRRRYHLRVADGLAKLVFRQDYYRNHLGYFLWDNARPLWKKSVAGWCSWMAHQQDVTEGNVLDAARFFSANLKDYGYNVIQIDDGYQRVLQFPANEDGPKEPFSHYWSIPNEKFPRGLQPLAADITRLGLTPGIWVGDYLPLGLKHAEGYVIGTDGKPYKGPWVNYAMNALDPAAREEAYIQTVRDLHAQGWRYFKIDTLRHVLYDSYRQVPGYWAKRGESMETAFRTLLDETKKAVPGSYLLACWGTLPELAGIPDGARIGEDVGPDVASMRRSAKYIAQFHYLNDVVWRNDPDYMCLRVPLEQARAWVTLTSLAGGHVMVSDPVKDYDPARVEVLRRVGPPLVVRPGTVVSHRPDPEFMTLNAAKDGEQWTVAARFGWGAQPSRQVPLTELGLDPAKEYLAFDFWKSRFLGSVSGAAPFEALAEGACQVVSFRAKLDRPQVLGTDRHLGQGAYELDGVRWDGSSLTGKMKRGPGQEWSLFVHVPSGWQVTGTEGARPQRKGEVLRLTFPVGKSPAPWKITFRR